MNLLFQPLPPWPFGALLPHFYNLIVVDPPWRFELYSELGEEKSAAAHYELMDLEAIQALPIGELADVNCLLLLWTVAPLLPEGIRTLEAWGFTYVSWLHWRKVFPSGKPAMGPGYRVRTMGELVLMGTIGEPRHKPLRGNLDGIRREHSRKPEEFYDHVGKQCAGLTRRADVFARVERRGWHAWGNEKSKFEEGAA
jgi:N6-adenosine-specific RNA methylase IME4